MTSTACDEKISAARYFKKALPCGRTFKRSLIFSIVPVDINLSSFVGDADWHSAIRLNSLLAETAAKLPNIEAGESCRCGEPAVDAGSAGRRILVGVTVILV